MCSTKSSVHPKPSSPMQFGPSSHSGLLNLAWVPQWHLCSCVLSIAAVNLCEYNALELATLTGNFSVLIGKGGVTCVYKGELNSSPVAVKMYDKVYYLLLFSWSSVCDDSKVYISLYGSVDVDGCHTYIGQTYWLWIRHERSTAWGGALSHSVCHSLGPVHLQFHYWTIYLVVRPSHYSVVTVI